MLHAIDGDSPSCFDLETRELPHLTSCHTKKWRSRRCRGMELFNPCASAHGQARSRDQARLCGLYGDQTPMKVTSHVVSFGGIDLCAYFCQPPGQIGHLGIRVAAPPFQCISATCHPRADGYAPTELCRLTSYVSPGTASLRPSARATPDGRKLRAGAAAEAGARKDLFGCVEV